MGYSIITHHLLVGYAREKKQRPKKEKAKKRHRPDFTRWDTDRSGKNALFFFFFFRLYADVREMRVGIQSKGDALTERYSLPASRGICCSSCTPRGRCSREI